MKLPMPLSAEWTTWARTLVASIAAGWTVEHTAEGRHNWSWTDVPYQAGLFTASSSTWTVDAGDVEFLRYALLGDRMELSFRILTTDVGSGNVYLAIALPIGWSAVNRSYGVLSYVDAGGTPDIGLVSTTPNQRFVELYTRTVANWTATTGDNTLVQGQIALRVRRD